MTTKLGFSLTRQILVTFAHLLQWLVSGFWIVHTGDRPHVSTSQEMELIEGDGDMGVVGRTNIFLRLPVSFCKCPV